MADQKDYGSNGDGKALVPGSLTCYRHFGMTDAVGYGVLLTPMHDPARRAYVPREDGVFTADCTKKPKYRLPPEERMSAPGIGSCSCPTCHPDYETYAETRRLYFDDDNQDIHTPPVLGCTCGFYAHYDPATDFYPQYTWGPAGTLYYSSLPSGAAVIRAVVEMTGTTVMGRRGVRAQTMRIQAISLDWAKYREATGNNFWFADPAENYEPDSGYRETVEIIAMQAARKYNARYFADLAEMYAAFPKADVSALGIEEALPEPPSARVTGYIIYSQPRHQPYTGVTKANGISASYSVVDEAFGQIMSNIQDQLLTPMQRAIKAKKNRPAPPGTGIDYRNRKPS